MVERVQREIDFTDFHPFGHVFGTAPEERASPFLLAMRRGRTMHKRRSLCNEIIWCIVRSNCFKAVNQ